MQVRITEVGSQALALKGKNVQRVYTPAANLSTLEHVPPFQLLT